MGRTSLLPRERPRRLQHAHRIRQPVGAIDRRLVLHARPRHGQPRLGPVLFVGLLAVAIAFAGMRQSDGRFHGPPSAGGAALVANGPGGTAASMGPHGDLVPRTDSAAGGAEARHAAWRSGATAPLTPLDPALLTGYVWPIKNARITNSYGVGRPGSFRMNGRPFHDGLDMSSFCGARITAAHDGVVLAAGRRHVAYLGWVGDLGPFRARMDKIGWRAQAITVVIDDGNGYRSVYAHLAETAVEKGEVVKAGDLIGWEGASGNATGCHLHYSIFSPLEDATVALDPRIARTTKLPSREIARIDPLLVLPPRSTAGIAWSWGAR